MQIKPYAKSLSSVGRNRGLATLVTATLVTTATLSFNLTAEAAILNDIDGSRNKAAILYLADKGVLAGYPDQTFKPNNVVNRAELLKILIASLGVTDLSGRNCFPDVTDQWFAAYVCYAKTQGWVSGYADGTFRPSEPVNKVEAIKMLVNSQGYRVDGVASNLGYADVVSTDWYAPYVLASKSRNLLEEQSGNLNVSAGMSREKIAEYVYRAAYIREKGLVSFGQPSAAGGSSAAKSLSSSSSSAVSSTAISTSNSAAVIDVSYAADLASWVSRAEFNKEGMKDFIEFYSKSASHNAVVDKVSSYLFEYSGLSSRLGLYAEIARTEALTEAQREEIQGYKTRMNEIVKAFNEIFGPQAGQ